MSDFIDVGSQKYNLGSRAANLGAGISAGYLSAGGTEMTLAHFFVAETTTTIVRGLNIFKPRINDIRKNAAEYAELERRLDEGDIPEVHGIDKERHERYWNSTIDLYRNLKKEGKQENRPMLVDEKRELSAERKRNLVYASTVTGIYAIVGTFEFGVGWGIGYIANKIIY